MSKREKVYNDKIRKEKFLKKISLKLIVSEDNRERREAICQEIISIKSKITSELLELNNEIRRGAKKEEKD